MFLLQAVHIRGEVVYNELLNTVVGAGGVGKGDGVKVTVASIGQSYYLRTKQE
jgi:hypothetical protein